MAGRTRLLSFDVHQSHALLMLIEALYLNFLFGALQCGNGLPAAQSSVVYYGQGQVRLVVFSCLAAPVSS